MNPLDIVRRLISLILDLVPATEARRLLDEAAIARANLAADAAEAAKFGGGRAP